MNASWNNTFNKLFQCFWCESNLCLFY